MFNFEYLLLLFCFPIILHTIQAKSLTQQNVKNNENVCMTRTCVIEAAKILDTIDESVNPCDDFYQFACGKWIQNKQLAEHKSSANRFSELQDELNNRIRELIIKTDEERESTEFIKNAKYYFNSCTNTSLLEKLGDRPLTHLLTSLGEWPLLMKENWSEIKWTELLIRLRENGLDTSMFFSLSISPDFRNNSRRILSIDQPSFGLGSRDILLKGINDSSVNAYRNLMIRSALKLGGFKDFVNLTIDKILEFETLLANNSMPKEERRNLTAIYNKMTIKELTDLAPNIDWLHIIRSFVSKDITEDVEIVLFDTNYIQFLSSILPTLSPRFLANYMIWRVIETEISSLNDDWYQLKDEFDLVIYGTKSRTPRLEMCLKDTKTAMSIALSHLYVKNFFSNDNKEKALDMFLNVVKEFNRSLSANKWMGKSTLGEALKKLDNMKLLVGYPDELIDANRISDYYRTLHINSSEYFVNGGRISKWYTDRSFSKLNEPVDPYDWRELSSVAVVNAYYHLLKNLVVMPAGILQGVFFNKDRPNYLNYGSIAYVSGHEIVHAFDDGGRQYDAKGNLRNWWDSDTDELYKEKTKCFVNQYSNYMVKEVGLQLNGINTLGENIADSGGIIQAYRAYQNYVAENGPELPLPALDYTPEQMFWVSSANQYCSKARDEHLKLQVMTDSHSPARQRVNGVVSNSDEFSKAYGCPVGSPMNPVDKCVIW